ncbi:hypothetical protein ACQEU5_07105 [Marinactinospora thermotolerans]|uniref:hypothetical protein n=1 Tax=Marinactinospora thermotolerans TaxID=531310 RepID=UPI003D8ABF2C
MDSSMPLDVHALVHLARVMLPELWERNPLPGEDLEETAARRDAALDILDDLMAELAVSSNSFPAVVEVAA